MPFREWPCHSESVSSEIGVVAKLLNFKRERLFYFASWLIWIGGSERVGIDSAMLVLEMKKMLNSLQKTACARRKVQRIAGWFPSVVSSGSPPQSAALRGDGH